MISRSNTLKLIIAAVAGAALLTSSPHAQQGGMGGMSEMGGMSGTTGSHGMHAMGGTGGMVAGGPGWSGGWGQMWNGGGPGWGGGWGQMWGGPMQPGMMRGQMPGPGPMPGHVHMFGCFMMTGENGAFANLDQRLEFLKVQIGVMETQKPQWDAYAGAVKRNVESMQAAWQTMWSNMMNLNFAERFGKQMEAMGKHHAAMQELSTALNALYVSLQSEQRARADGMLHMMGCQV